LDLFWARLAVHIRAEHLHLFPTVLTVLKGRESSDEEVPSAETAHTTIARLREDHDFFMHELANAVTLMREMRNLRDDKTTLKRVARVVSEVKQRLSEHNKAEELEVYRWLKLLLNSDELAELASLINAELGKRPPRFTDAFWTA
jgi:iron-sulfur cluster repair protein YtfE (RIC family)